MPVTKISSSQRDARFEAGRAPVQYAENPAIVLQDIVMKSGGGKVEFRTDLCDTAELQFSVEVWLVGDKISEGIGRTRKEARHQAVMTALQHLAKKYVSPDQIAVHGDWNKLSHFQENGFTSDSNSLGHQAFSRDDHLPVASTSDSRAVNALEGPTSSSSVAALKELCTMEGYTLNFQVQPSSAGGQTDQPEAHQHALVEIAGQIMGKGIGKTWAEAKIQAAEEALESLKSMLGQFTHKRPGSPRFW